MTFTFPMAVTAVFALSFLISLILTVIVYSHGKVGYENDISVVPYLLIVIFGLLAVVGACLIIHGTACSVPGYEFWRFIPQYIYLWPAVVAGVFVVAVIAIVYCLTGCTAVGGVALFLLVFLAAAVVNIVTISHDRLGYFLPTAAVITLILGYLMLMVNINEGD